MTTCLAITCDYPGCLAVQHYRPATGIREARQTGYERGWTLLGVVPYQRVGMPDAAVTMSEPPLSVGDITISSSEITDAIYYDRCPDHGQWTP